MAKDVGFEGTFEGTLERMLAAGKLKNMSALAHALTITPQAISNYKKRGEMPANLIIRFARVYGLSVDYLLSGAWDGASSAAHQKLPDIANLSPDELVYMGKVLQVLRGNNIVVADLLKWNIKYCQDIVMEASA